MGAVGYRAIHVEIKPIAQDLIGMSRRFRPNMNNAGDLFGCPHHVRKSAANAFPLATRTSRQRMGGRGARVLGRCYGDPSIEKPRPVKGAASSLRLHRLKTLSGRLEKRHLFPPSPLPPSPLPPPPLPSPPDFCPPT
jgi:hypothetical protein